MKTTKKVWIPALLLGATAALAGCGGDSGNFNNAFGAAGEFRVVNGISDSTSISVSAPNVPSDLTNITVNTASGFRTVPPSTFNATVTVNNSTGSTPTFTLNNVAVSSGQETTAYFPGKISDNSFATAGFAIQNGDASIANGNTEVTLVHAASAAAATVDVYVTTPGASLPGAPTYVVNYRGSTTPAQITAGTYEIRVALDSAPTTVVFDSGTAGVTLAAGSRLQIAALNETDTTRNSPIRLLVIPSDGSAPVTLENVQ
jgi:hypothetical protein